MMFDIHCHLIPGMDDGADLLEESLQMLRLAASGKTAGIICTPHCGIPDSYQNYYSERFERHFLALRQAAADAGSDIRLYPGQEVFLTDSFVQLFRSGKIITLNRSEYLLCEFDPFESAGAVCRKLERVCAEGCIPIVAHPERYHAAAEDVGLIDRMKAAGALLQINKGSLKGAFGPVPARIAHRMLAERKADFVASDAHSPYVRTTFLADVHEMISELYSIDYSDHLLRENPMRVIKNQEIYHY